jgi:hypothetical protein
MRPRSAILIFVFAWTVIGLLEWWLVAIDCGPWIELFNGATWAPKFIISTDNPNPPYNVVFYALLSLRTLLNLGVLLTAATVAYLLLRGKFLETIMNKLQSVSRTHNVLLAQKLLQMLEDRKVNVPASVEEELVEAARTYGTEDADKYLNDRLREAARA